jgi:hypothetical protein
LVAADLRGIVAFLYESPFLDLEVSSALAEFKGTYATDQNRVRFIRGLEYPEISRIVVSLAAIIRSATDANRDSDLELERPVGVILPDTTRPRAWQSLEFREACNKILHADLSSWRGSRRLTPLPGSCS